MLFDFELRLTINAKSRSGRGLHAGFENFFFAPFASAKRAIVDALKRSVKFPKNIAIAIFHLK